MSNEELDFLSALRDVMLAIEGRYPGMIIGGIAIIAWGYPRVTTDIDVTLRIDLNDLNQLVKTLRTHEIYPRIDDAINFARTRHVLLMRHHKSGVDIDVSLALLPFEEEAISNRQFVDFSTVQIAVPRPEDLVIYKMVAFRPEDLRDVEELLLRHSPGMNLNRVRKLVREFAKVLDRPQMVEKLEELLRKTRPQSERKEKKAE